MGSRGTLDPFNQYHLPSLSLVTITATNILLRYLKPKAQRVKIPSVLIVTNLKHSVFCWTFENSCPVQTLYVLSLSSILGQAVPPSQCCKLCLDSVPCGGDIHPRRMGEQVKMYLKT